MIKTLSINLNGQVFQINEDAYNNLSNYIDHLEDFYKNTEGKQEIISDIEARFAEIFSEKVILKGRTVIAHHDTMEVIEMMGKPEDFDVENDTDTKNNQGKKEATNSSTFDTKTGKRFYRDTENGVVAGVCSGIAAYFGISDPVWIRLLFILLFFAGGSSFLLYFILWIAIQEAKTNTQKLEMKGEKINLENLEKSVREELNKAGNNIQNFVSKNDNKGGLNTFVNFLGSIFLGLFNAIFWVGKHFIYFIALVLLFALFIALMAIIISGFALTPELTKYFFENSFLGVLGVIGAVLFVLGPILLIILGIIKVCSSKVKIGRPAIFSILGSILIGLILICITGLSLKSAFSFNKKETKNQNVNILAKNTLGLQVNEMEENDEKITIFGSDIFHYTQGKGLELGNVKLDITPTYDSIYNLSTKVFSQGNSLISATKNANEIKYNVVYSGDKLIFDPYFYTGKIAKWRNQYVRLKLEIPEGKTIVMGKNLDYILSEDTKERMDYQSFQEGSVWQMVDGKLIQLNEKQNSSSIGGNDNNLKSLSYSDFEDLSFSGNFDVEIRAGSRYNVLIDPQYESKVDIQKNGDVLSFDSKIKGLNIGNQRTQRIKIIVISPNIEKIELKGATKAYISGFAKGDLTVIAVGGSEFNGDIEVDNLSLTLTGGCNSKLIGSCDNLELNCIGASSFKGFDFETETAEIKIVGASNAKLNISSNLTGNVTGASSVVYKGNPDKNLEINGASDVSSVE